MKWFKHENAFRQDPAIAAYLDACGRSHLQGYGFLMMVLETVAAQMKPGSEECEVTYSVRRWSRSLESHANCVSKFMTILAETGVVEAKKNDDCYQVRAPILLKLQDEYFRKTGPSPESIRTREEKKRIEKEERRHRPGNDRTVPRTARMNPSAIATGAGMWRTKGSSQDKKHSGREPSQSFKQIKAKVMTAVREMDIPINDTALIAKVAGVTHEQVLASVKQME